MKFDIQQAVTEKIIAALERGTRPWSRSWDAPPISQPLRSCGEPYKGINTILLWAQAQYMGYLSPYWMTFRQAKQMGGAVRSGEKSTMVVFYKILERENEDGEEEKIPLLRYYNVFNAEQINDLPDRFLVEPLMRNSEDRIDEAEEFIEATGAKIRYQGTSAFYNPVEDFVQVPAFEQFEDAESYYGTQFHELVHWTGHKSRLDRLMKVVDRASPEYAREELVAELGAAFLCARLGISPEPRESHASYIDFWVKILKEDKKAIFKASTQAQKAVEYLS